MGLLSHTWIGCFLAFLPDYPKLFRGPDNRIGGPKDHLKSPPIVKFNSANFALYPIDKINKYCPYIEPGRDIGFYFFSRKYWKDPKELRIGDDVGLSTSGLDFRLPTVIYFTPFFDGLDSINLREVKEAYLIKGGHNMIAVVAERLNAGPWYPTAVSNTLVVGRYAALFVDYLVSQGLPIQSLHFVGLSIGAHTAGIASRFMTSGKPPRITGLDPASWLFVKKDLKLRLDKSDADFVDVIHTDRIFGMWFPIGHVDFFVNAQVYPQPGCNFTTIKRRGPLFAVFCSHLLSNSLYASSVLSPNEYPGLKCSKMESCSPLSVEFMGSKVSSEARGTFLVTTDKMDNEIT